MLKGNLKNTKIKSYLIKKSNCFLFPDQTPHDAQVKLGGLNKKFLISKKSLYLRINLSPLLDNIFN